MHKKFLVPLVPMWSEQGLVLSCFPPPPTCVLLYLPHSGQLCEIPPHGSLQPNACEKAECQNGANCVELGSRILCQCLPGFGGPKCEKLLSVNFVDRDTYLQFTDLQNWPSANITLQVRRSNQSFATAIPKAIICLLPFSVPLGSSNSFSLLFFALSFSAGFNSRRQWDPLI